VGFLQRPANLLTGSHCRADFLLRLRIPNTAEEARLLAKEMKDSETKDALLRSGDNYEHLAEWVEDGALRRLSKN
jgi:hypothetical protein